MASTPDIEVVLKARVEVDPIMTDVNRWSKLPMFSESRGPNGPDPWDCGRFYRYRGSHPSGDKTICTLCGAVVGRTIDGTKDEACVRHFRWHMQLALVEECAEKWFSARGERELEEARADTLRLRDELADTPPLPNPRNCRS